MIAISEAVADLLANPRAVLFLDTCDFLDVPRGIKRKNLAHADSFERMLATLATDPSRFQLVITYLVRHEWGQNITKVWKESNSAIQETSDQVKLIHGECSRFGFPVPPPVAYTVIPLVDALVQLSENLMCQAMVIEKDSGCIERALERLMDKRRPSHSREIKDSIHLKHYLETTRQLRLGGFAEPCLFVSSNKSDFWDKDKNGYKPNIHPDLRDDLKAVGLQFLGKLGEAVGQLRI